LRARGDDLKWPRPEGIHWITSQGPSARRPFAQGGEAIQKTIWHHVDVNTISSRPINMQIGAVAGVVDAIDARAARFYRRFNFIPLPDSPDRLFLAIRTIAPLFRGA